MNGADVYEIRSIGRACTRVYWYKIYVVAYGLSV
jgi:hypothetical protein